MQRTVLVVLVLLAGACGKKKAEPPPPPFTGPLTVDRIMASKDAVKLLEPWATALPKLEAKLGKPQKIDDTKGKYQWAVVDGEVCAYVEYRAGDGKEFGKSGIVVTSSQSPMKVEKDGPMMNRADCLEIAGISDLPPEDPNAAAPPADGIVAPADFEKLALAARSKWEGKKVKVTGKVVGTGGLLLNVDGASCILATNADSSLIGQTVTAEGTVRFTKGITGGGKRTQGAELGDCVVSSATADAVPAGSGSAGSGSSK